MHKTRSRMCWRLRSRFRWRCWRARAAANADSDDDPSDSDDNDDAPEQGNTVTVGTENATANEEPALQGAGDAEAELYDSDSSGEEEAAVDDADNVPEAVFRETERFDTLMEVFRFIVGCNLNLALVRHWRTLNAVMQYGMSLLVERREYVTHTVTIPGCPTPFEVTAASGKEVRTQQTRLGSFSFLHEESSGAGRVYTTPDTATFWEEAHKAAAETFGEGTVVMPLIISSDATLLSGNERTKCGPRMSAADKVALFQSAMKIVLADLVVASHTGMAATDPNGVPRFMVPLLFSCVADYPETFKVSCTQQLGSAMPCSICYVGRTELRDMDREPARMRTVEQQESLLGDPFEARRRATLCIPVAASTVLGGSCAYVASPEAMIAIECAAFDEPFGADRGCLASYGISTSYVILLQSFLWDFKFSRTVWGNTYLSLAVDILHAIYVGFWVYIRDCLHGDPDMAESKDGRMVAMSPNARLVGIRIPGTGMYWASGANFTASEHGAVMMGWNLLKVHLLTHLPAAIRHRGLPQEFSAALYKNAHIRTCKLPYRASNHRAPTRAIARHNTRAGMVAQLGTRLTGGRRDNTALERAIRSGTPQLTRTCRSLTGRPADSEEADSVFELFNTALGGVLLPYSAVMHEAGLAPFPAKAHSVLALPARQSDVGTVRAHYVRAAVSMHGQQAFSCVEYETTGAVPAHGRLLLLLSAERDTVEVEEREVEVAVVQRLTDQGLDERTGCRILTVLAARGGVAVIPIGCIRRAVHCVQSFVTPGRWYLNRWAYRCNECLT
ncbi:unnamed protein product [Closterium sp. Yama58-4]|nr:unnamed protein product [Closterium sp. Yama58-4]